MVVASSVSVSSGSQTAFGAEVGYRVGGFGASVSGLYGSHETWGAKLDLVSEFAAWEIV